MNIGIKEGEGEEATVVIKRSGGLVGEGRERKEKLI